MCPVELALLVFIINIVAFLVLVVLLACSSGCRQYHSWLIYAVFGCFGILAIAFTLGLTSFLHACILVVAVLCFGVGIICSFYQVGFYISVLEFGEWEVV